MTAVEAIGERVRQFNRRQAANRKETPEACKTAGVYYTPPELVDFLVRSGLRRAARQRRDAIRVLDPACGSGAILVGAYDFLLKRARRPLTLAQRQTILLEGVFGVDIDAEAVEVAKLSLLLKMLEDTTATPKEAAACRRKTLAALSANVKCGNALVGPDFFHKPCGTGFASARSRAVRTTAEHWQSQCHPTGPIPARSASEGRPGGISLASDSGWHATLQPFDWSDPAAGFGEILADGGFDAVVGNPPYIDSERMTSRLKPLREYCTRTYCVARGNWDIFCVFAEKAVQLCRRGGTVSLVVPNKLASAEYAAGVRRLLAVENRLLGLRDYSGSAVFPVGVYPLVFTVAKQRPRPDRATVLCAWSDGAPRRLPYRRFFAEPDRPWELFGGASDAAVIEKMRMSPPLDAAATVLGAATVAEAYRLQEFLQSSAGLLPRRGQLRVVNSGTIDRYRDLWSDRPLRYLGGAYARPVVAAADLARLSAKRLAQARTAKILVAGMTRRLECTLDLQGRVLAAKSTSIVLPRVDARLLLGILNSKAASFFFSAVFGGNRLAGGYFRIGPPQLKRLPVPILDSSRCEDQRIYAQLANLVERMMALQPGAGEIAAVDRRIDRLIYRLYGLTDGEIAVVEAAWRGWPR